MGAYLSYTFENPQPHDAKEVEFRLGLSYLSQEKACSNLDEMKPESFDSIRKQASQLWEEMVAGSIKVSGPLEDSDMKLLYSNLYRVFLMPVDKTGENPDWPEKDRNEKPYFDDFYCIWDTFRTLNPLLTLIAPSLEAKMLNSLIVTAQNMGGLLGDSLNGNNWGIVQSGSNADILFSEALQKGIPGVDYNSAFELLLRQMDTDPEDFLFQGRGDMKSWKTIGYIPAVSTSGVGSHFRRSSGSRTVEYAYGDFAIAQMARILGQYKNETTFLQRSNNWENLWDDSRSSHGFTGFLVPKYQGEFIDLDPAYGCIPQRGGNAEFYEDCSWTYSFYAPHNMSRVIQKVGGDDAFIKRVDAFFDLGIYNPGNEPGFLVPFLYHYVGRPDLSVARSINITDHLFLPVPEGLPGNDDAGTMAALHIFWSLGLFPIAGQDICEQTSFLSFIATLLNAVEDLILSPVFAQSQIRLGIESNKYLHLIARNLTTENRQVLSATLNGQPLTRAWIRDKEIRNGATIVLNMGSTWTGWGQKHRPPSY
ncbi:hypothetical protein HDU83_009314 [Entophlyctis luteolus]|nr:hypothetical protein HDU83_009314 [Entophlyctis luteolus]KAJ3393878.1 hypothetical protein HDU84_000841 [Entophlyctis sp. JEL0112]